MKITLNQIKAFATIAQCGSFAQAALVLNTSQPALSISIKNLEDALGGKLFARTTRSLALTPEGRAFYPVVKRLLSDWEQSLEDVRNHFALKRGKVEIAAMPTFASNLLPDLLGSYHRQHPNINVTVHDVIAEAVISMVREGRCELGICFHPGDAPDLIFHKLFSDRFEAILPRNHPLLAKPKLRWKDVLPFPHIALQKPAGTRLFIEEALGASGLAFSPALEAHQLGSIGRMVSAGLGVSVVPRTSRRQMLEMGLEYRPISAPVITHRVGMIVRRQQPLSAGAAAMAELIRATDYDLQ